MALAADALRHYIKIVSRASTKTFSCPECNIDIIPKNYEAHCTKYHKMNSKLQCVWCRGARSWNFGQKKQNADHLINCFRKFIHNIELPPLNKPFVLFDHTPMCTAKDFFGHKKILSDRAYETIWPLNFDDDDQQQLVGGLRFQNPNINKAVSCVRYYLKYFKKEEKIDTFHIMVKANIYDNFIEAMDKDAGQSRTLEFSCWCDGGKHEIDKYRQHKHMIVISKPKGHFIPNVWKKIKTLDKPYKNFPSLRLKRIESPMHLVNTIGYLSQRESRCNFTFDRKELKRENLNHFYIALELPTNYKIILATQWEDGLMNLLQHKTFHIDEPKLMGICKRVDGRWQIQVKDIPGLILNLILPVEEAVAPSSTTNKTRYFMHLTKERKMYFDSLDNNNNNNNNNNDDDNNDDWIRLQIDGGNLFFNVVGDEYVILRQKHQRFLTNIEPIINEIDSLKAENTSLKTQLEEFKNYHNSLQNVKSMELFHSNIEKLKEENASLKTQLEEFKSNFNSLQNVIGELKRKLETNYTTNNIINNNQCTITNQNNNNSVKRRRMSQ